MPVMIARHLFLMTGAYQRVIKHATSKACSHSPSVSGPVGGTGLVVVVAYCHCVSVCVCSIVSLRAKKEHVFSLASIWPPQNENRK